MLDGINSLGSNLEIIQPGEMLFMSVQAKILYVDDSAVRLNNIKKKLENQGYEIWTAKDVSDALRMLRALDFEALVVEQRLMNLNREQLRQVNAINPKVAVLPASALLYVAEGETGAEKVLAALPQAIESRTS